MKRYIAILLLICMLIPMAGCTVSVGDTVLNDVVGQIVQEMGDEIAQQASEALDDAMDDLAQKAQDELDKAEQNAQDIFKDALDKMQGKDEDASDIWDDEFADLPGEGDVQLPHTGPEETEGKTSLSGEPYIDPASLDRSKAWYEGWFSDVDKPYYYIFYANGGSYAPEPQKCFYLGEKITKEPPVRVGYHFMGWATEPCGEGERYKDLFPFEGKAPENKSGQDIELYAVWGKHTNPLEARTDFTLPTALWLAHEYSVKKSGNAVTIFCSCGMEITDRTISKEEFLYYCYNEKVGPDKLGKKQKEYILYRAHEIGPVALELVGSYYQDINDKNALTNFMDEVKELAKITKRSGDFLKIYAAKKLSAVDEKIFANEFFSKVSGTAKQVCKAVSICKATYYFSEILGASPVENSAQVGLNLVNAVENVIALAPHGWVAKPLAETLKEGMKLYAKVDQYEKEYAALLETIPLKNTRTPYLDYVLGKDAYLVMEKYELGCTCGKDETKKNACPCEGDPSVYDVLLRIQELEESEKHKATQEEEFLLGLYLAERITHEFYIIVGVSLDDYAKLLR